ncbi:DUF4262 domain-containing protein [Streptomyces sp. LMG1-1-1.1]|uniref:DUF4262 domain-containing protein n=1 Tax=Streptomyces sp. LMG1-1-1.1 TaxID=3135245 RepID=UPI003467411D
MDLTVIEHVQQHGWHVVMVPEGEIGPGFAYTIGLTHSHTSSTKQVWTPQRGRPSRMWSGPPQNPFSYRSC